eukprot:3184801-Pyramimonas_sp.AAC.1
MDIIYVQETHLSEERCKEASDKLKRDGWHVLASAAVGAAQGRSGHGGLLQLAPRVHGLGVFEPLKEFSIFPGRASVAHFEGV